MKFELNQKINILIHYDTEIRQDWRFLSRTRLIIASIFIGVQSSIVGWVIPNKTNIILSHSKLEIILISSIISIIGIIIMAWFGSSINKTKLFIVNIEEALALFEKDEYLDNRLLFDKENIRWGKRKNWRWGKSFFASILFGISFPTISFIFI
jgi:hypothetical protein